LTRARALTVEPLGGSENPFGGKDKGGEGGNSSGENAGKRLETLNFTFRYAGDNNCVRVGSNRFNIITIDYRRSVDSHRNIRYIMYSHIICVKILPNTRTPLCNNRRVDSVRHIPITFLPEKARIRSARSGRTYVRACAAVKPLNRSPGKLAEKYRIQYGRDTRIYGLPHCGSRVRIPAS